ncbi:hypothetical protein HPB50_020169 [Hyalomma asiaticum]|uniref:Uncharacterized protein n=1 Tax=Hyalomma asiaticum TaxID=266040 RepID=A0ACB7TMN9_HYAAI|nr:hypothetical protein HPB50_020169 [Hyalomma asiaticum]
MHAEKRRSPAYKGAEGAAGVARDRCVLSPFDASRSFPLARNSVQTQRHAGHALQQHGLALRLVLTSREGAKTAANATPVVLQVPRRGGEADRQHRVVFLLTVRGMLLARESRLSSKKGAQLGGAVNATSRQPGTALPRRTALLGSALRSPRQRVTRTAGHPPAGRTRNRCRFLARRALFTQ